ncbi:MAG: thiamine pyrophosphate-dependent enzyme, partial [Desulfobacterales bacterium]
MNLSETLSKDYIESQYKQWKTDANSVSPDWRFFFEGFEMAAGTDRKADVVYDQTQGFKQARVEALIRRYREIGHLLACFDPLTACPADHPLLNLSAFGLTPNDLDTPFFAKGLVDNDRASLKEIIRALKETYCRSIGVESMHLQDPEERKWLQDRMEPARNTPDLKVDDRLRIMGKLYQAVLFEQFLHKKYLGQTRFSIEGAEVVIPMLDVLADRAASLNCREIILGMAHRGRLNVQTNILNKPYEEIFSEFESCHDPDEIFGAGDVKYHDGYLADVKTRGGLPLRIFLVNNPSHLESVNPVVEGFVRGRQDILKDDKRNVILPLLIHGDAAFSGQGVVTETLNMSQLTGYKTGGTVHIVINNQIGYTTLPEHARSTRYATDVAKMLMIPIFHVHGEDPESVVHVIRLALDYRETFHKDVVVDVVCFRRYGHNEGDEPYFTQPKMYDRIRKRPPLNVVYSQRLIEKGVIRTEDTDVLEDNINRKLEEAFEAVKSGTCVFPQHRFYENWKNFNGIYTQDSVKTGVPKKELVAL